MKKLIKFHPQKEVYLDKEAQRIFTLIRDLPIPAFRSAKPPGSFGERPVVDLTDKMSDAPLRISNTYITGETVDLLECHDDMCFGFDATSYIEFSKFIGAIWDDNRVKSKISKKFVLTTVTDWLFQFYREKKADTSFSKHLTGQMNSSVFEYQILFPILHLEIDAKLDLGKTSLFYFTREELNVLEDKYLSKSLAKKDNNPYQLLKKEFLGQVFISFNVSAEYNRAREIAFDECSLTIDTLKICSLTTDVPHYRISFDIDSRTKMNSRNQILYIKDNELDNFRLGMYKGSSTYKIDRREWQSMQERQLKDFHLYLLSRDKWKTELNHLIINSIKLYAAALTSQDLHSRIVNLFTILESLLLKNQDGPILDSICKYSSKLVFSKVDDRKHLINLVKRLYRVRSARIHHAKELEFDIEDLRQLQITVVMLLLRLIKKLDVYETKIQILTEIDERILEA